MIGDQRVGALYHLRPDNGCHHPASKHERDRSRLGSGIGDLRCREPQVLGNAEAEPCRYRAQAVDDKVPGVDPQGEGQAAAHHDAAAQPEAAAPADPRKGDAATSEAHMTATIWIAIGSVFNAVPDSLYPTSEAMTVCPDITAFISA